jgi:Xaa-Pro aminopeptidase
MDRTASRREDLRRTLEADKVGAYLVSNPTNVRYLTGFTGEDSVLLLSRDRAILVSDGRFTTQLTQECPDLDVMIRDVGATLIDGIVSGVASLPIHSVGFETAAVSVAEFEALRSKLGTTEMVGVSGRIEALRVIKDDQEVAAIREAIGFAEDAFAMLRKGLRSGVTEKDVADALEGHLRHAGATAASFPPIVAVGARSALPHARPTQEARIGDADFVLIDWGATGRPYKSDLTRVLVTGKVTSKFEKIYRTVLEAQERAIAAIRPGVMARDVDAEARSVIVEAGFGPFFSHGLGHGLGMDIHEEPRLRKGSETVLQPGMVVTVEPGVYLPDWGGVRIEDDVLITDQGAEVLTHVPRSLDSVLSH